jgi:hypothetical protein
MTDNYPVPALAFYDPAFLPLTTSSSQVLRVNEYNHLYVTHVPGTQVGAGPLTGYVDYDDTAFYDLDAISLLANQTIYIYGLHSAGDLQGIVELVVEEGINTTTLLVGVISESSPNWDPPFGGIPMVYTYPNSFTVTLRIKALRNRIGSGSGRIFARVL